MGLWLPGRGLLSPLASGGRWKGDYRAWAHPPRGTWLATAIHVCRLQPCSPALCIQVSCRCLCGQTHPEDGRKCHWQSHKTEQKEEESEFHGTNHTHVAGFSSVCDFKYKQRARIQKTTSAHSKRYLFRSTAEVENNAKTFSSRTPKIGIPNRFPIVFYFLF